MVRISKAQERTLDLIASGDITATNKGLRKHKVSMPTFFGLVRRGLVRHESGKDARGRPACIALELTEAGRAALSKAQASYKIVRLCDVCADKLRDAAGRPCPECLGDDDNEQSAQRAR